MPSDDVDSLSSSADYIFIEDALKSLWEPFCNLILEMKEFELKKRRAFKAYRNNLFWQYRELNPSQSAKSLLRVVNGEIDILCRHDVQFNNKFQKRFMSQYIIILFTSHALCEAAINAIMARGLYVKRKIEIFDLLERQSLEQKWHVGPKVIDEKYNLPRGESASEALRQLVKERNYFTHHKIGLESPSLPPKSGSQRKRQSYDELEKWCFRFFNLPYDLCGMLRVQLRDIYASSVLYDRSPIRMP